MGHQWGLVLLLVIVMLTSASDESASPPALEMAQVAMSTPTPKARDPKPPAAPGSELLAGRRLAVPVQGVKRSQLRDNFNDKRGVGRVHKAIDIMAPWGTPVLAADDGKVAKISSNRAGGLALYQSDSSGRLVYYYAHLAGYAEGLREGQAVKRGDVIGYVGATGNAPDSAPHLHFQVMLITQERRWWGGEAINPYEALARTETATVAPP